MNTEALAILRELFREIGWLDSFEYALNQDCCKAYLHGLCDSAYSEWGSAQDFMDVLCEENNLFPCDIAIWDLDKRFPHMIFREDPELGFEFARGRLFSLRDYQLAKEALSNLGEDEFEKKYCLKFGKRVPDFSHLH